MKDTDTTIADPIQKAFQNLGLTVTGGYERIRTGEHRTQKDGRRRRCTRAEQRRYVERKERSAKMKGGAA